VPVLRTDGASRQQRGFIIGLVRQICAGYGLESDAVARIERVAKLGPLTREEAVRTISELQRMVEELEVDNQRVGMANDNCSMFTSH
jgi:hypothetical protein